MGKNVQLSFYKLQYLRLYPRQNGANVYCHVGLTKVFNIFKNRIFLKFTESDNFLKKKLKTESG